MAPVPKNEVTHLLSVRSKCNESSKGTWARMKNGKYKGDLAQVLFSQIDHASFLLVVILIFCVISVDCGGEWCSKESNSEADPKNWSTGDGGKICYLLIAQNFVFFFWIYFVGCDIFFYCFDSIYRFFFLYGIQISETKTNTQLFMIFFCYVHFTWATALKKCIQDADKLQKLKVYVLPSRVIAS